MSSNTWTVPPPITDPGMIANTSVILICMRNMGGRGRRILLGQGRAGQGTMTQDTLYQKRDGSLFTHKPSIVYMYAHIHRGGRGRGRKGGKGAGRLRFKKINHGAEHYYTSARNSEKVWWHHFPLRWNSQSTENLFTCHTWKEMKLESAAQVSGVPNESLNINDFLFQFNSENM